MGSNENYGIYVMFQAYKIRSQFFPSAISFHKEQFHKVLFRSTEQELLQFSQSTSASPTTVRDEQESRA